MKKTLLIVLMLCLLLTGCGKKEVKEKPKGEVKEPAIEEKKISIIDMDSNSRPYAVVINNYPSAAKVQAGLNDAYIVYEFPIEGGITRSLALFKDKTDVKVGTIRSARQNYIDYAMENDAIFVHFGWNVPAQNDIKTWKIDYIDGNTRDNNAFKREKIGEMPTELFFHFFKSFSDAAKCNLNVKAEGENEHHKIEAIFKAFAKCIKIAIKRDLDNMRLPSTKGLL